MKSYDKLLSKLREIESEMVQLEAYCQQWQMEYYTLTDQYMNGNIRYPIGDEQRAITKKIEKAKKQYNKLYQQAYKIKQRLYV